MTGIEQFKADLARIAAALPSAVNAFLDLPAPVQLAVEMERAIVTGRTVGLTDAEAREVVEVWASIRGVTVPWDEAQSAMIRRAMGEEWRP